MCAYACRSSILGSGSTIDCLYYIWGCYTQAMSKNPLQNTKKVFLRIFNWSIYWLWLGRWPTHDWRGVEYTEGTLAWKLAHETKWLAGGHFGMFFCFIGDLDWQTKWWELENYDSTTRPCYYCPATLGHPNWRDFKSTAAWVALCYTQASWAAAHPDRLSTLSLEFISIYTLCTDWMHIKYLGSDQYFYGSILYYMVTMMMSSLDTPEHNMSTVMGLLRAAWRDTGVDSSLTFHTITIRMFSNKDSH